MNHDEPVFLVRRKSLSGDGGIPLEEWLRYVASSSLLHAKPRVKRIGINPFTKRPAVFRSPPGAAFFDAPNGRRCEVEYHAGGLIVRGAFGHAKRIVSEIVADLGVKSEIYDATSGITKALPGNADHYEGARLN